jgi:hypothetical protein
MTDLDDAAVLYAATFAGNLNAYSVHNGDHWQAVRRPLTGDVVLTAFATSSPVSGYVLSPDSTTHVAALDIDRDDGYALGTRFIRKVAHLGGMAYVERSSRGAHAWVILAERLPGITVRRALRALINESGLPPCPGSGKRPIAHPKTDRPVCPGCMAGQESSVIAEHPDPKIELRPGSDKLSQPLEGEPPPLGHCIRLPTMPHQRSHIRHALVDPDRTKLSGKLTEMMLDIETCPTDVFIEAAQRAPLPDISPPPLDLRYRFGPPPGVESASDILRDLWGVENARPGRAVRCPAHDDQHPSLSILRDDQRAICKSPSCELSNDGRGRGTYELRTLAPSGS